ncbi:class I SAM-dependent methyltransferase [Chelatococcus reniformis]|uniref:S-adenosylmethionine-dependent methyltransferase n=1 Tax=Chelatococcus reniformis TaxID=1494448 RepID=A0A916U9Y0_9HYPH|nr:class I SAM-dependent methyltransferase [Chelatococcus reniformis]GGC64787.1 S-adenosylmethionine-dependent methyltransferase [Chelatococcus reniformis]
MSIYADHVGPRLVRCLCGMRAIAAERRKVVPQARGVVIEIGFGPGLNLPFYDPARVARVIGVDPNDSFIRLGATRPAPRLPIEIVRAPAERVPLPDASADTAVITYTLCSVHDPLRALSEVRRVLRPDGRVLFLEHGLADDAGVQRWQHRLNPIWRALAVGCNLDRPVTAMLRQAGFQIHELAEFYLPKTPRAVGFHARGVAMPAPDAQPPRTGTP